MSKYEQLIDQIGKAGDRWGLWLEGPALPSRIEEAGFDHVECVLHELAHAVTCPLPAHDDDTANAIGNAFDLYPVPIRNRMELAAWLVEREWFVQHGVRVTYAEAAGVAFSGFPSTPADESMPDHQAAIDAMKRLAKMRVVRQATLDWVERAVRQMNTAIERHEWPPGVRVPDWVWCL